MTQRPTGQPYGAMEPHPRIVEYLIRRRKQTKHRCRFFSYYIAIFVASTKLKYNSDVHNDDHFILRHTKACTIQSLNPVSLLKLHTIPFIVSPLLLSMQKYTIVFTKTADDALYLTRVVCPMFTTNIHVVFQRFRRCSPKRIEIISVVDADAHPVVTGSIGRIQVAY